MFMCVELNSLFIYIFIHRYEGILCYKRVKAKYLRQNDVS